MIFKEVGDKKYFFADQEFSAMVEFSEEEGEKNTWVAIGNFSGRKSEWMKEEWESFFKQINEANNYLMKNKRDEI